MVIAYHLVWTGYGWWLPNDPRGSGSRCVAKDGLREFGQSHLGRRAVQPRRVDVRKFYDRVDQELEHELIRFDREQIDCIGNAFSQAMKDLAYTCFACAVMPDHVHLIIRKHRDNAETMIDKLQAKSALAIFEHGGINASHPIWTFGGWRGFLDSPSRVWSAIRYVERNPIRDNLPSQNWPFVTQYNNWPFHRK